MFRKEFVEPITSSGMATMMTLRPLLANKNAGVISEFELLKFENFDEVKFAKFAAQKYSMTFIDLSNAKIPAELLSSLKKSVIVKYRLIPIQKSQNKLSVATFDPTIKKMNKELNTALRTQVDIILTTMSAWQKIFGTVKESLDDLVASVVEVQEQQTKRDEDGEEINLEDIGDDVITYVNKILAEAFLKKVSDIHVEPYEKNFRIRFRVDGSLLVYTTPPVSMMLPIISRLKIMAKMDIAERRLPQDGRIKLNIGGQPIDYRVSSLPTLFGEKIVLRLLDQSNLQLDMTKLGFEEKQIKAFQEGIFRPFGMVLVTGPTGSGKTTTLYSAMMELNKVVSNISTAEDPVEFNLEGINQVNVRKEIGLTFSSALKSFLRQDPDIIMVGEIRDLEVGEVAVEAALTGHLVLSTLHTNDAPSTITRMLNMGIEPFMVTSALNVIVAQRLCRKICLSCRVQVKVPVEQIVSAGIAPASAPKVKVYKGKGCEKCNGTGYKGRVAIYEVLSMTPKLRELVLRHASSDEIKAQAIKEGMKTLRMCALTKVAQGLTTLEEAVSTSSADDV